MTSIAALLNPTTDADQPGFYDQEYTPFRTHEQLMMTYGVNLREDGRIKSVEAPLPNLAIMNYADMNGLQTPELLPFQKEQEQQDTYVPQPVVMDAVPYDEDDADTEPDSDHEAYQEVSKRKSKKPQQWDAWKKSYDELVQYLQEKLYWPPSKGETLGKWCTTQRTLWRREQLDDERYKLLNDVGFIWHPPNVTYDRLWDIFYHEFKQLQQKSGPIGAWCNDERMNWWMSGQRYLRKIYKMPEERIALLDELGFIWTSDQQVKQAPAKVAPVADNKTPEKKRKKIEEDVTVSSPVTPESKLFEPDQRVTRRREKTVFSDYVDYTKIVPEFEKLPVKKSKLSPPVTRNSSPLMMIKEDSSPVDASSDIALEEVGSPAVPAKVDKDDFPTWMQNYNQYIQFWEDNLFYPATDSSLGKWACRQRTLKRRSQLASERIELLDKFGFIWDQPHARQCNNWAVFYEEAIQFKKENGHLRVPMNSTLNWWMALQRFYRKNNKLPEERIKDLDALDFEWAPKKSQSKPKQRTDDAHEQIVPSMKSEATSKSHHFLRAVAFDPTDV